MNIRIDLNQWNNYSTRWLLSMKYNIFRKSKLSSIKYFSTTMNDEVQMLEKLLKEAKERIKVDKKVIINDKKEHGFRFNVGLLNSISPKGLKILDSRRYNPIHMESTEAENQEIHAILLRSHILKGTDVPDTVRVVARCGSGTNNIDVYELTKRGIPVLNTPGANANAVKELTLCAFFFGFTWYY